MSSGHKLWFKSGKVFYGQTSPNLTFLLEIMDDVSSGLKRRKTFQRMGLYICHNYARKISYFEHATVHFACVRTEFCGGNVRLAKKKVFRAHKNLFCI